MASRRISIFDSFLSGGRVGNNWRSSWKAALNASTRTRSLVACAVRYFSVARRCLRRSTRFLHRGARTREPFSSTFVVLAIGKVEDSLRPTDLEPVDACGLGADEFSFFSRNLTKDMCSVCSSLYGRSFVHSVSEQILRNSFSRFAIEFETS